MASSSKEESCGDDALPGAAAAVPDGLRSSLKETGVRFSIAASSPRLGLGVCANSLIENDTSCS